MYFGMEYIMTRSEFATKLEEVFMEEASKIQPDTELDTLLGWDSMGKVAFLSFLDLELGVQPPAGALDDCKQVSDLIKLVEDRLTG